MAEDSFFPKTVAIDTCSHCNFKCIMCPHENMERKKGRMEFDLFKKIVDEIGLKAPKTNVWMVFFGEALILKNAKPSIYEMISYAKSVGLKKILLNTNAALLDSEAASKIIEAGVDEIYIGIDASEESTYESIRVGGKYADVIGNINGFLRINKKMGNKVKVQIQFIQMDENEGQVEPFKKYWLSRGVNVKIRKKVSWGGLVSAQELETGMERHECYWAMDVMAIIHNGDVVTCPADPEGRYVSGNVKDHSLSDVWNGQMKVLRQMQANQQWHELPAPCNDCLDWQVSYEDRLYKPSPLQRLKKYFLS